MSNQVQSFPLGAVAITAAATQTTPALGDSVTALSQASYLAFQATFLYGSGGTTAKSYVQTSLDGGATWVDVACFAFTTASGTKVSAVTAQIAPAAQAFTPSDGSLADNTIVNGVLGALWRVKVISVGTYAGNTALTVTAVARG